MGTHFLVLDNTREFIINTVLSFKDDFIVDMISQYMSGEIECKGWVIDALRDKLDTDLPKNAQRWNRLWLSPIDDCYNLRKECIPDAFKWIYTHDVDEELPEMFFKK